MKTIEQKAIAYDKALDRAIVAHKDEDKHLKATLERIFPELAESEDERMRKTIIDFLKNIEEENESYLIFGNTTTTDMIAWLEKLGEKPQGKTALEAINEEKADNANKVEPKFNVGDWVIRSIKNEKRIGAVTEILPEHYIINFDGWSEQIPIINGDCIDIRHWNIQDAKDGDVLHSMGWHNDCIFIFNGLDNWRFDEPNGDRAVATGYCCLFVSADKMEFGMQGPDCVEVNTVKPATKEQRDLLFQKMHEAGYTFDFEKKELKKIEQKPTECIKFGNEFENQISHLLVSVLNREYEYNEGFVKYVAQSLLGYAKNELKSIEWSEEDEDAVGMAIIALEDMYDEDEPNTTYGGYNLPFNKAAERLKSLKQRHAWKPSDEDEKIRQTIINEFEQCSEWCCSNGLTKEDCINWLNRQKYAWKPSYEQMEALWCATEKYLESDNAKVVELRGKVLESLYNDLKRLRDE